MNSKNHLGKRILMSALGVIICGVLLCRMAGFTLRQITGEVGVGTIITAFFMGPLIDRFSARVARPFLNGGKAEDTSARV